nr:hypothetical protein [Tanacetum cinerariifolium]GFB54919.1 hypothetical protein [Tanacetum cinerariifolium]
EAVTGSAEGTLLPVAPDAFSTKIANLIKVSVTLFNTLRMESKVLSFSLTKILDMANQETLLEVPIDILQFSNLGGKTGDSGSESLLFCWDLF